MKKIVAELLEKALEENESLFLIDFSVSENNQIRVVIDGDNGVTVNDCIAISRAIEHNIDRDEIDFSLDVSLDFSLLQDFASFFSRTSWHNTYYSWIIILCSEQRSNSLEL